MLTAASHPQDAGCIECHFGIEEMHPEAHLSCTDCHGGDGASRTREEGHAGLGELLEKDERVLPRNEDLSLIRFRNPSDLRVADQTCGQCHEGICANLLMSLHGTTAGHLSDGYYEMGLLETRTSPYSVFPQTGPPGTGLKMISPPAFSKRATRGELKTHYADLPRKECMQCHLWSVGRGVRGRVGFDGDYRGAGCAACHVEYAMNGLSASKDDAVRKTEPGHPIRHEMTGAPRTNACTACHYGDASIGLHFRGLSQLPSNAPGGPEVLGTTSQLMNRAFYINDASMAPPDVHHERGMHCIDCHTASDVMGDGQLRQKMEDAVEISCAGCHGTFDEKANLLTERGSPLKNLEWRGDQLVMRGKVDGREYIVRQVVDVIDPGNPDFNEVAAEAMTAEHRGLECYVCHAGWNSNFLGFHFSRHEQLSQLDLVSGRRTGGRVSTQEKVFATWKSFYAGRNEKGAVAPYMTGFSTMGSAWDEAGGLLFEQVMPVTQSGLSGMTMIHHQPHSTRPTARTCVECHRTSVTWGMGSPNFRLARELAFIADRRGVEIVAIERSDIIKSVPLMKLPLPDVVDLVVKTDKLQGHAGHLYVAEGGRGVHVIDVGSPVNPVRVDFLATDNPRGLFLDGSYLYVADGPGGLKVFDVEDPSSTRLAGTLSMFDAHDVVVSWPWAYVADGPAGLCIADIRNPIAPKLLGSLDLNGTGGLPNDAIIVANLFQYSRPTVLDGMPADRRTRARNICAVLDRKRGLYLVDVSEPEAPLVIYPPAQEGSRPAIQGGLDYRGLAFLSQVDFADPRGGEPTAERDYVYVLAERGVGNQKRSTISLVDVSNPLRVVRRGEPRVDAGGATEQLVVADYYSVPTRRRLAFTLGDRGVYVADLSTSRNPVQVGAIPGLRGAYALTLESFALDRMIDDQGRPEKDISHEHSRFLSLPEIAKILSVRGDKLFAQRPSAGGTGDASRVVRLHMDAMDIDRTGSLEGQECVGAGGPTIDSDKDGRITLLELGRAAGIFDSATVDKESRVAGLELMGDELAKLLDGINPFEHTKSSKGLSRSETEQAFFHALDLNRDGSLTRGELSRYPGKLRGLRHGGTIAAILFETVDRNRDGQVSPREFRLEDREWNALDVDADGVLLLLKPPSAVQHERGFVLPGSEWPCRRERLVLLPPGISVEALLKEFDRNSNEVLEQRELKSRPDLLLSLDENGDRQVDRPEIARMIGRIDDEGVDSLADDLRGRWDLDGSGVVEPDELPERVRRRLKLP